MLDGIRENIALRLLRETDVRGRVDYMGFAEVRTVGILFSMGDEEHNELVRKYMAYLREEGKQVKAVGFFPSGKVPPMIYSKLEYEYFSLKALDFLRRPKQQGIEEFIGTSFDLLIDMNLKAHFPLYYIARRSAARLKIGIRSRRSDAFDLIIDTDPQKGLKNYLRIVDQYLEMLGPAKKAEL